jgi:hypothetical protein
MDEGEYCSPCYQAEHDYWKQRYDAAWRCPYCNTRTETPTRHFCHEDTGWNNA